MQSKQSSAFLQATPIQSGKPSGVELHTKAYAGRTLDLTLFALTRAVDTGTYIPSPLFPLSYVSGALEAPAALETKRDIP